MENFSSLKVPFLNNRHPFFQLLVLLALWITGTVLAAVLSSILTFIFYGVENSLPTASFLRLTQSLSSLSIFLLPALLYSHFKTGNFLTYTKIGRSPQRSMAIRVLLLSLAIIPLVMFLADFNGKMSLPEWMSGVEEWMRKMENQSAEALKILTGRDTIGALLINIVVMAILPALSEEFFFRGAMQPLFNEWFKNKHIAIWVTAFIFSVIHFQFFGFIPRFLLGAYLGYLLVWSRSLWLPILAHFMHNFLSIISDFFITKSGVDIENMELNEIPGITSIGIISLLFFSIGVYSLYRSSKRDHIMQKKIDI